MTKCWKGGAWRISPLPWFRGNLKVKRRPRSRACAVANAIPSGLLLVSSGCRLTVAKIRPVSYLVRRVRHDITAATTMKERLFLKAGKGCYPGKAQEPGKRKDKHNPPQRGDGESLAGLILMQSQCTSLLDCACLDTSFMLAGQNSHISQWLQGIPPHPPGPDVIRKAVTTSLLMSCDPSSCYHCTFHPDSTDNIPRESGVSQSGGYLFTFAPVLLPALLAARAIRICRLNICWW